MKIAVIDTKPGRRRTTRNLLRQLRRQSVFFEWDDWNDWESRVNRWRPDLVVADWNEATISVEELKSGLDRLPDLVLALYCFNPSRELLARLYDAGVRGVVPRSMSDTEAIRAFDMLRLNGYYVPPQILDNVRQRACQVVRASHRELEDRPRFASGPGHLTERQHQIMRLIKVGSTNKDIARDLKLAEGTVKIHVSSAFRALGVPNRAAAVAAYDAWIHRRYEETPSAPLSLAAEPQPPAISAASPPNGAASTAYGEGEGSRLA